MLKKSLILLLTSLFLMACGANNDEAFEMEGESDNWSAHTVFKDSKQDGKNYVGDFTLEYIGENGEDIDDVEYNLLLDEESKASEYANDDFDKGQAEKTKILCENCEKGNDKAEIEVEVNWQGQSETFKMK